MKHMIQISKGINRANIEVKLSVRACNVAPYLTIDGKPVGESYTGLSIVGSVYRNTGLYASCQCIGTVREVFGDNSLVSELCDIWDKWHLNGMSMGTRAQSEALKSSDFNPNEVKDRYGNGDHYASACKYLSECGLNPDPGMIIPEGTHMPEGPYRYGHAWLVELIPAEVEARINELCKLLGSGT